MEGASGEHATVAIHVKRISLFFHKQCAITAHERKISSMQKANFQG